MPIAGEHKLLATVVRSDKALHRSLVQLAVALDIDIFEPFLFLETMKLV